MTLGALLDKAVWWCMENGGPGRYQEDCSAFCETEGEMKGDEFHGWTRCSVQRAACSLDDRRGTDPETAETAAGGAEVPVQCHREEGHPRHDMLLLYQVQQSGSSNGDQR